MSVIRGNLDWITGARSASFLTVVGIGAGFWFALALSLDRAPGISRFLFTIVSFLIIGGVGWIINGSALRRPPAGNAYAAKIILAAAAIGPLIIVGGILWGIVVGGQEKRKVAAEIKLADERFTFEQLGADAPFEYLLPYFNSQVPSVRQQSRDRIAHSPNLENRIDGLLLGSYGAYAADYIANVYDAPPVTLSKTYAQCLDAVLADWKSTLEGNLRGPWQRDLENYFRGAERLQKAGGNLRPQLTAWHAFLSSDPRLAKHAKQVQLILQFAQ